ncbi:MAG: alpha/beta hydrolase [Propionibacteriaceae bacterium]|nr:alpha/beta hydrolase [Propionibacteriaceae bacterium]
MAWRPDPMLPGYECREIPLPQEPTVTGETPGSLRATLVRRNEPSQPRAVLYVHGWNDYFFHTHVADFFASCGVDFYAIDLRRYGRSLVEGQKAGYISALSEYYAELDAALALVRADHDRIAVLGHSTGALTSALWVADRPGQFAALLLNAPWVARHPSEPRHGLMRMVLAGLSSLDPLRPVPSAEGFYARTLHVSQDGEWDYNLDYKGHPAFKPRLGWCQAVLEGHSRVAKGLNIDCPVFAMLSKRYDPSTTWSEALTRADVVFDVGRNANRVPSLGDQVTVVRIDGAKHDVFLSLPQARQAAFAELSRWMSCYFPAEEPGQA